MAERNDSRATFPHAEVWAVLVATCGARVEMPQEFVIHFPQCREYRFMGALGFGGKIYADHDGSGLRVACYPEDTTPERATMIAEANALLAERKKAGG